MAMKVVGVETERIVDNNPNTYLKRAEDKLRIGEYDNAISELELVMKYSNHSEKIIEQCDRIKLSLIRGNIKKPDFFFENKSQEEIRRIAVRVMENFEGFLDSYEFGLKCKVDANKLKCDSKVIKNVYVGTCINSINDILKVESTIYSENILQYNNFFNKAIENINQYCIEECKILIIRFYLINIEQQVLKRK